MAAWLSFCSGCVTTHDYIVPDRLSGGIDVLTNYPAPGIVASTTPAQSLICAHRPLDPTAATPHWSVGEGVNQENRSLARTRRPLAHLVTWRNLRRRVALYGSCEAAV